MEKKRVLTYFTVIFLLSMFAAQAVITVRAKSPTCDELAHHIPVGYVLLSKGDIKMDTSHPPLSRYIVALPLVLFMDINMPTEKTEWRKEDRSEFGKAFFYKYNNDPHRIIFLSRLSIVAVGVFCGLVLFLWAKALFGLKAALLSLFFYAFSPNLLAHSSLATTDLVATFFIFLSVFCFWGFVKDPMLKNLILSGICLGLAQLSKYTALLLYPLFVLFLAFEFRGMAVAERRIFALKLLFIFSISVFVLWAGYGFDTSPLLDGAMRVGEKIEIINTIADKVFPFWNAELSSKLNSFLLRSPFPLGTHLLGILGVIRHGYEGHGTFFCGEWSSQGSLLYFVLAFLIKTPIPAIIFIFVGFVVVVKKGMKRNALFILVPVVMFFLTASFSKLQLGLRYILPMYPFCMLLAGKGAETVLNKKILKIMTIALMFWYAVSSLWICPDYLSYFNELIGGPKNGYKYLRDSNVDWGQDLPALAEYMRDNSIKKVKLFYFGTADPSSYGIKYELLSPEEFGVPGKGVYAISVHKIDAVKWAGKYEPAARLGNSIFIYDFQDNSPVTQ